MCRLRGWEEDTPFSKFSGWISAFEKRKNFEEGFGRFCPLASLVSNYYYSIFIVFTPNANKIFVEEEGKRREEEVSRG